MQIVHDGASCARKTDCVTDSSGEGKVLVLLFLNRMPMSPQMNVNIIFFARHKCMNAIFWRCRLEFSVSEFSRELVGCHAFACGQVEGCAKRSRRTITCRLSTFIRIAPGGFSNTSTHALEFRQF